MSPQPDPQDDAKRLLAHAARQCPKRAADLEQQVQAVLQQAAFCQAGLLAAIDALVDGLEEVLQ